MKAAVRLLTVLLLVLMSLTIAVPSLVRAATFNEILLDSTSNTGSTCTGDNPSWSHTIGQVEFPLLLVEVAQIFPDINAAPSAVTWGSTGLTLVRTDTDQFGVNARMTLWALIAPARGTLTISVTASGVRFAGAQVYYNVFARDGILANSIVANGGSVVAPSNTVTVSGLSTGNRRVDFAYSRPNPSTGIMSPAVGQTETFNIICDSAQILGGSHSMATSMTWTGTWPGSQGVIGVQAVSLAATSGAEGGGGGGGGGPALPVDLSAACPLSSFDWLVAQPVSGHRDVAVYDGRSEAALAILYIVGWGDGKQDSVSKTPVNHTYQKDDIYTLTVRVQYRTGLIEVFNTQIDTRGNNCALQKFANEYMGILAMLAVLLVIAAIIVTASRRRLSADKRRLFSRAFLWLGVGILATVLMIAIYALLAGIPI